MPILIQRMIFDYVPKNAPFWIRPIVKTVFDQLKSLLVAPEIKKNITMVCIISVLSLIIEEYLISVLD